LIALTDSVRAFKERNKLGRFKEVDPEEQKRIEEEKQRKEKESQEKADSMKVGDR
jgi:tubulin-folding cofactor B